MKCSKVQKSICIDIKSSHCSSIPISSLCKDYNVVHLSFFMLTVQNTKHQMYTSLQQHSEISAGFNHDFQNKSFLCTYFHCKARRHHVLGPFEVCGVNTSSRLDQENSFAVGPETATERWLNHSDWTWSASVLRCSLIIYATFVPFKLFLTSLTEHLQSNFPPFITACHQQVAWLCVFIYATL